MYPGPHQMPGAPHPGPGGYAPPPPQQHQQYGGYPPPQQQYGGFPQPPPPMMHPPPMQLPPIQGAAPPPPNPATWNPERLKEYAGLVQSAEQQQQVAAAAEEQAGQKRKFREFREEAAKPASEAQVCASPLFAEACCAFGENGGLCSPGELTSRTNGNFLPPPLPRLACPSLLSLPSRPLVAFFSFLPQAPPAQMQGFVRGGAQAGSSGAETDRIAMPPPPPRLPRGPGGGSPMGVNPAPAVGAHSFPQRRLPFTWSQEESALPTAFAFTASVYSAADSFPLPSTRLALSVHPTLLPPLPVS